MLFLAACSSGDTTAEPDDDQTTADETATAPEDEKSAAGDASAVSEAADNEATPAEDSGEPTEIRISYLQQFTDLLLGRFKSSVGRFEQLLGGPFICGIGSGSVICKNQDYKHSTRLKQRNNVCAESFDTIRLHHT